MRMKRKFPPDEPAPAMISTNAAASPAVTAAAIRNPFVFGHATKIIVSAMSMIIRAVLRFCVKIRAAAA